MRTLCLNLQKEEKPSVAENFLIFSPRVYFRDPGLVFVDISSTSHLFGGEECLLREALSVSKEFYPQTRAAIADTPFAAQVFAHHNQLHITPPTNERDEMMTLPLDSLEHLEGLMAWRSRSEIEDVVQFFKILGMNCIGEIKDFEIESFRERWKSTGTLLWKRLHGLDRQVISPLQPSLALTDYVHLDFSISLLSFLLHCLERSMERLFARLQGRGEFARKIQLHLYCEYSNHCHLMELIPTEPNRDFELYMKLLENKLAQISLDNPIKEFEIEVVTCPEKIQQFDFWEPRVSDKEKLKSLISVFHQASLTTGFMKPQDEILPENSWMITSDYEEYLPTEDSVDIDGQAYQLKPAYSESLQHSPRPSRILKQPQRLSPQEVQRLHFLSHHPIERLEERWWEESRGRDYYFALSSQGQCLWVFHDQIEDQYYIHGYFD